MDPRSTLSSLIAFDRPLVALRFAVEELDPQADVVVALRRQDIAAVLQRFLAGELEAAEVAAWAELVECREDVEFEARHEEAVADALFDLGNPDAAGPLAEIAAEVLERLH